MPKAKARMYASIGSKFGIFPEVLADFTGHVGARSKTGLNYKLSGGSEGVRFATHEGPNTKGGRHRP